MKVIMSNHVRFEKTGKIRHFTFAQCSMLMFGSSVPGMFVFETMPSSLLKPKTLGAQDRKVFLEMQEFISPSFDLPLSRSCEQINRHISV